MKKQKMKKKKQQQKNKNLSSGESSPEGNSTESHVFPESPGHDSVFSSRFQSKSINQSSTLCVIGLGNPGSEYANTRHNAGFWLIDDISRQLGVRLRRPLFSQYEYASISSRSIIEYLKQIIGEAGMEPAPFDGAPLYDRIILVRPLTFMNRSGIVLPHLLRKFGKPLQFLIAVDNMDLLPGKLRLKKKGGTAGHNGLKSITEYLNRDFWPLYIGVGRPGTGTGVIPHVMGNPDSKEMTLYRRAFSNCIPQLLNLFFNNIDTVLQWINTRSDNITASPQTRETNKTQAG